MKALLATIGMTLMLLGAVGGLTSQRPFGSAIAYAGFPGGAPTKDDNSSAVVSAISKQPKTWVGVRLTPVPAALAAHIGHDGVMIANVVSDGPADRAGVQQYDVVVSFDGEEVRSLQNLADAIGTVGAGAQVEMVVLRKGAEQRLTITPEPRPVGGSVTYKYEEPTAETPDDSTRYFGHRLQRDPSGAWVLEPLGRMDDMPQDIQGMLRDVPGWRGMLGSNLSDPFQMQLDPDNDDPSGWRFFSPNDDSNASVSVDIRVNENGKEIAISRQADGAVDVTREENGSHATTHYDNLDALRESDPDAYETYRRYSGYRAAPMITVPPTLRNLPDLQWDFQRKIEQQLQQAREKARDAMNKAGDVSKAIRNQLHSGRSATTGGAGGGNAVGQVSESISMQIDNGRVVIDIDSNGETSHYEFDNVDQLKAQDPKVYEKVKHLLGEPSELGGD